MGNGVSLFCLAESLFLAKEILFYLAKSLLHLAENLPACKQTGIPPD